MTRFSPFPLFPLALAISFIGLAGCLENSNPSPQQGVGLALRDGLVASYTVEPTWDSAVPVNFTVSVKEELSGRFEVSYAYTHPTRSEFDSEVRYVLDADGAWKESVWECMPTMPDEINDGCESHLGGYGTRDGGHGAFFGFSLLAGLKPEEDGIIRRPIEYGTRVVEARFRVEAAGEGLVMYSALDASTRRLPTPVFGQLEPFPCSIFRGNVTVDVTLGIPVRCSFQEDDGEAWGKEEFGWSLTWTNAKPNDSRFGADLSDLALSPPVANGVRMPHRDASEASLPFGFYEALDYAAQEDSRVRQAVADPKVTLMHGDLGPTGVMAALSCDVVVVCVKTVQWEWEMSLLTSQGRLNVTVLKDITYPGHLANLSLGSVESDSILTAPRQGAVGIPSLGALWDEAKADLGFSPGLVGFGTFRPVDGKEWREPFVGISFAPPPGEGFAPTVYYRTDGTLAIWMASGAQPAPFYTDPGPLLGRMAPSPSPALPSTGNTTPPAEAWSTPLAPIASR